MIYDVTEMFNADQVSIIDPERLDEARIRVALAPVRCIDCETYFPIGWVAVTGAPRCPAWKNAPHRAEIDVIESVVDSFVNRYAK